MIVSTFDMIKPKKVGTSGWHFYRMIDKWDDMFDDEYDFSKSIGSPPFMKRS